MILRLALRELWHARGALLLQVASLTIAIAALSASAHLNAQTTGGAVPGAGCAEDALQLSGVDGTGNAQDGWTPRQAEALMHALGQTPAAEAMNSIARTQPGTGVEDIPIAFVSPAYFKLLCVTRRDPLGRPVKGPFQDGVVVDAMIVAKLGAAREIYSNASVLGVQATTSGFKGLQFKSAPVQAWAPYSLLAAQGEGFINMDSGVIHVLIHPRTGESVASIETLLDATRQTQPTLFAGITRIHAGPALQINVWTASKIHLVTGILRLFASALLLLVMVNLLAYHAGRLPGAQALATTLAALGVPPVAIWRYAAIEPCGVGMLALLAGSLLSLPLGYAALAAVTNDAYIDLAGSWATLGIASAVTAAITTIIVAVRGRVLTRRQSPSRTRAQRTLLSLLPWLLTLQVALAVLTLTLAAQAAVGLVKAVPPAPNFPLAGLSVVEIDKGESPTAQEHVALRWNGAWHALGAPGYKAALATTLTPFLPTTGFQGGVGLGTRSSQGLFDYVTADFFDVLGAEDIKTQEFNADVDSWRSSPASGATHIVLNADAAQALFGGKAPSGMVARINHDIDHQPSANSRAAVVLGVFDDGIVGARGAVGKIELSKLSMQASVPVVYQSLTELRREDQLLVFVRHPVDASQSQIAAAILPAVHILLPRATVAGITDARTLFRNPLRKERAMALVLALLAVATLAIGLLGIISLMTMLLRSLKVELAVRYAVGATRLEAAHQLVKRLAPSALLGLLIGAVPAAFGLFVLAQTLETLGRAGVWGPVIAGMALALVGASVLFQASRQVLRAHFMDWLRYE